MNTQTKQRDLEGGERVELVCRDGVKLSGHLWRSDLAHPVGNAVINPATGVPARYYHRYARFLAGHGFNVLTYDYRGIGQSRPAHLKGCRYRWRDWSDLDFDAAIGFVQDRGLGLPLSVVGHSIGGFLIGLADKGRLIDRALTVGAQYAWWGDYARHHRARLFVKWHVIMPLLTLACGYFPGRSLGWLEDLPSGVAYEWSFRGRRFERSYPQIERSSVLSRMAAMRAPILAIVIADDELGTVSAVHRTLGYYKGADRLSVLIEPGHLRRERLGHFDLFHDRHASDFWPQTLLWLRDGRNPWPKQTIRYTAALDDTA